jgi:hypothetical protein
MIYRAQYKLKADAGHRMWPLGPHPNKSSALDHFRIATKQRLGTFKIDEASCDPTDYFLVELDVQKDEEQWFHLVSQQPPQLAEGQRAEIVVEEKRPPAPSVGRHGGSRKARDGE